MRNLAVWYHCKISGSGIPDRKFAASIVEEQMSALEKSGLSEACSEIHIGINGPPEDAITVAKCAPEKAYIYPHGKGSITELTTFSALRKWLPLHSDYFVMYHHSKGVTQREWGVPNIAGKAHHRRTMEKCVVWNWKQCVSDLDFGYDAVGINWVDPITRPVIPGRYFVGNFWWAKAEYLLELPPLPDRANAYTLQERVKAEAWIGSCHRRPLTIDYERPELSEWCKKILQERAIYK